MRFLAQLRQGEHLAHIFKRRLGIFVLDPHGLGRIDGRAAAHGNDPIRLEADHGLRAAHDGLDGRIRLNAFKQLDFHSRFGGVVPEIASSRHCEFISATVKKALLDAGKTMDDVDAVAVTFAPGLIGAVLVGVNFAKGLAYSANKPLVPVHHLRGHIAALYLTHPELKPPFLCLVASGGHSHIVEVQDYTHYHILGHTVDDAAGEAFDKVARTLGLPYPGGPSVANAAKTGDPKAYRLPVPHVDGKYNVSFSGLKTAVLNEVNKAQMKNEEINVPDLAASFQERIAGILAEKLLLAAADTGAKQVCLAGGVAANGRLRQLVNDGAQKLGAKVYLPELKFCGDNGAMIAAQGYYQYMAGHTAGLDLNGLPTLPIDYE